MLDEFGEPMADQVWIQFGRIKNIKCVDYFRVTYTKTDKTGVTTITSDPIDRIEKGSQMTVVPCTLYTFRYCILLSSSGVVVSWVPHLRVAAYEEFHGTGRRFKMLSSEVNFTLDYTPKFTRDPLVWERKASPLSNVRMKSPIQKRDIYKVSWNESFIFITMF